MIGALVLAAAVSGSAPACPLEKAVYGLRDAPAITARFEPRTPTPDWPADVQMLLRAKAGTYVFLPYSGNGQGVATHLASVNDPAHPPGPDEAKGRPLGDLDYLVADATYRFDQSFRPKRGAVAPAHLFLPGLQNALWYQASEGHREGAPMAFFDLKACGNR